MPEVIAPVPVLGRPKETVAQRLKDGWQQDILDLYKVGASDVEIRLMLADKYDNTGYLSQDLWDRWIQEEEIFSLTVKKGREYCKKWWETEGRTNLTNKEFSPVLWYMNMKNRFGWKDKQEVENTGEVKYQIIRGE